MIVEVTLPVVLSVALGGALGAASRFLLDAYVRGGLLIANTVASLLLGVMLGVTAAGAITFSSAALGLAAAGFLGALSTFATVSLRAAQLWMTSRRFLAVGLWFAHTGCGLAAAAGGAWLGWALAG